MVQQGVSMTLLLYHSRLCIHAFKVGLSAVLQCCGAVNLVDSITAGGVFQQPAEKIFLYSRVDNLCEWHFVRSLLEASGAIKDDG